MGKLLMASLQRRLRSAVLVHSTEILQQIISISYQHAVKTLIVRKKISAIRTFELEETNYITVSRSQSLNDYKPIFRHQMLEHCL